MHAYVQYGETVMSVAQTRAAARKMKIRYRGGKTGLSIAQSMARERAKAQREQERARRARK